jgi:HK97 family phage prohead protease
MKKHKDEEKRYFTPSKFDSSIDEIRIETNEAGDVETIRGVAAVFNRNSEDLGGFVERMEPGAFDNVMDDDVRATIDHEGGLQTVGRTKNGTLTLEQTERGLEYVITPPDTRAGNDLKVLIKGGFIDQSSFAFRLKKNGDKFVSEGGKTIRTILKGGIARLYDVSPVTYPAYPDTSVAVRSLKAIETDEEGETAAKALNIKRRIALAEAEA